MAGSEADALWSSIGGTVPIRASTMHNLAEHLAQPKFAFLGAAMQYIQAAGWAPPLTADVSGYRDDLNRAVQEVILNGADPMEALTEAEQDYNNRHGH
jgi:ABC-type glycerol-3-phosphate transport system substrate-binding protein